MDICCHDHVWSHGFTDTEAFKAKVIQVTSTKIDPAYAAVPSDFVTQRTVAARHSWQSKTHPGVSNHWDNLKLEQLFGLPDLESKEGSVAYCISSGEIADLLREVQQGRTTRLKQAMIIEDLFIW